MKIFASLLALLIAHTALDAGTAVNARTGVTYTDLNSAISDAVSGDELRLSGTFTGNFTIGINLMLEGREKSNAILDGNNSGSVLTIDDGATVALKRLTIQNGNSTTTGGGINSLAGSSINLKHVQVQNNSALTGGGISVTGRGVVMILESFIGNNTATSGGLGGGGIYLDNVAQAFLAETKIVNNQSLQTTSGQGGGGLYAVGSEAGNSVVLSNVDVKNNRSSADGGGIAQTGLGVSMILQDCCIHENRAAGNGGGFFNGTDASATFVDSREEENRAANGGGIFNDTAGGATLTLVDNRANSNYPNDIVQ